MNNTTDNGSVIFLSVSGTADSIVKAKSIVVNTINVDRANTASYVVFCRSSKDEENDTVPYGAAFLIAILQSVEDTRLGRLVTIGDYAPMLKRNAWPSNNKIGVAYYEDLTAASLRLGAYKFFSINDGTALPEEMESTPDTVESAPSITDFDSLHVLIANALGVNTSQVSAEITVKMNNATVKITL